MSKNRRNLPKEEGASTAWMNTYADMVTLLLSLFVLLYAFSNIDAQKWKDFVRSFTGNPEAFQPVGDGLSEGDYIDLGEGIEIGTPEIPDALASEKFDELYEKIVDYIDEKGLGMELNAEMLDDIIVLHIMDSALFDSGKAAIRSDSQPILDNMSVMLVSFADYIRMIRIEGHTDNVPIYSARFHSNWELSTSRAVTVLEYLLENSGIVPEKFSAVGYGEFRPVDTNDTEEGKAKNRRVDFVIESINVK